MPWLKFSLVIRPGTEIGSEWIAQQLELLGHTAHLDAWEVSAGGNIAAWMEKQHDKSDHVLCVMSSRYLEGAFSAQERHAALWASASKRPNFLVPVFIESCEAPTLIAPLRSCELYGLKEIEAQARLREFLKPAVKPSQPVRFPGEANVQAEFPGKSQALSNIPITVPRYFLGRDDVLNNVRQSLVQEKGRVAITTLHGLRGVGKTTLAAAYALRHRGSYRVTWWIRAETESTMRADLVGLGVRLGWLATKKEKEEEGVAVVMERIRDDGDGILLIFDNAKDADSVESYFPAVSDAHILVTSNAHAWRDVATPVRIDTWPSEVGARYLMSRTGRSAERQEAVALSIALGGLPLAHEQAAAYCERLGVSLGTYRQRFAGTALPDDPRDAPRVYHDRLTAAKAFDLAIGEAAKLHPCAERLIIYASLLAPEPIPLSLFMEGRENFSEPFASSMEGDRLDEAVAALRVFALVDRESIPDERDPSVTTDCIRLHRLVRHVAAAREDVQRQTSARDEMIGALAKVYPQRVSRDPPTWPLARRLDAIAIDLTSKESTLSVGSEAARIYVLNQLAAYRREVSADFSAARPLLVRALTISKAVLGRKNALTAMCLNSISALLDAQGDQIRARAFSERALAIREAVLGPDHLDTADSLNDLGFLLQQLGDLDRSQMLLDRALAIRERELVPDHPDIASTLNNLGILQSDRGDLVAARKCHERALAIRERTLSDHPDTAVSLHNLAELLDTLGEKAAAKGYYERALGLHEKILGAGHPETATTLYNLAYVLEDLEEYERARACSERALAVRQRILGLEHPDTAASFNNLGALLTVLKDRAGAGHQYEQGLAIYRKIDPTSLETGNAHYNLAAALHEMKDHTGARYHYEQALAIYEKRSRGSLDTGETLYNLGDLFASEHSYKEALACSRRALDIYEERLGIRDTETLDVAQQTAEILDKLDLADEAKDLRTKFGITRMS